MTQIFSCLTLKTCFCSFWPCNVVLWMFIFAECPAGGARSPLLKMISDWMNEVYWPNSSNASVLVSAVFELYMVFLVFSELCCKLWTGLSDQFRWMFHVVSFRKFSSFLLKATKQILNIFLIIVIINDVCQNSHVQESLLQVTWWWGLIARNRKWK